MKKSTKLLILAVLVMTAMSLFMGCSSGSKDPEGVLFILPEKGVDHVEFTTSKNLLEANNIKFTLASTIVGEISDDKNEKFQSSILIKNAKAEEYKLIAVMGGNGMKLIEKDEDVMKLLQDADKKEKQICAICYGPVLLARAGILDGHEAAVYPSPKNKKALSDNGAVVKPDKLVVSGNIVTAQGPSDSEAFAEKLVELLK